MTKKQIYLMALITPFIVAFLVLGGVMYFIFSAPRVVSSDYLEADMTDMAGIVDIIEITEMSCAFDYLIGQTISEAHLNLGRPVRIIQPGDMVTEDYRPERVNVYLDDIGNVDSVVCG